MFSAPQAAGAAIPAPSEQKTPVMEHKGLFSGWGVFPAYAPRLQ
jgi:hypothetical protein